MKNFVLTSVSFFLFVIQVYAAEPGPLKWGKVDKSELEMTEYPQDPEAGAVVLSDFGTVKFNYRSYDGITLDFERHVRIKILKKSGLKYGDVTIPVYKDGVKLAGSVKGVTFHLENGKIQETKLDKGQIFKEEFNDFYDIIKFSMPNVKEGTVFEYKYTLNSQYLFSLVEWEFQRDIPVRWSEYHAQIPDFLHYKTLMSGYLPLTVNDAQQTFDMDRNKVTNYKWAVGNAPAMKEEQYVTTMSDFISKIEFELQTINIPGQILKHISHTWEKLNDDLNNSSSFGKQIGKGKYLNGTVTQISATAKTPEEKAKLITRYVRENIKYNGKKRVHTSQSLKKVLEEKKGNSADVNLLLVSMLQEAGLEAYPVILSTREHGRVNYTPLLQDFNYVVAYVKFKEEDLLLDGTDPGLPYDMLPFYCLNKEGRLISPEYTTWIPLSNNEKLQDLISGNFKLHQDGSLSGELKYIEKGYRANSAREKITDEGEEKYLESMRASHSDWAISSYKSENLDDPGKQLEEVFDLELKGRAVTAGDKIYLQPMIAGAEEENPFKLVKREYPVDFGCPIEKMYMFSVELPEGFIVEELPETALFALPDRAGVFRYNISNIGNKISVSSSLKIEKPMFVGEEYESLKQFYNLIVAKHAEQIVLKKAD